jgi:hypothetical protein
MRFKWAYGAPISRTTPARTPASDPKDLESVTLEPRRRHLRVVSDPDEAAADPNAASAEHGAEDLPRIGPRGAAESIPDSVWEEISRAAGVWESLREDGRQLRYDIDESSGRVLVELCDLDGSALRPVSLVEALGTGDDDSPAA